MTALDRQVLTDLEQDLGDPEFVVEVVELYLSELPRRSDAMLAAAARGDVTVMRAEAHSLGSASAMVGALAFRTACRAIEQADDAGLADRGTRDDLVTRWRQEHDAAEIALTQWRADQS